MDSVTPQAHMIEQPVAMEERPVEKHPSVVAGDLFGGYETSLDNLVAQRRQLKKLREQQALIDTENTCKNSQLEKYNRYLTKVEKRDRSFPEYLTCLGCRRR